jgi:hypothetical protein
MNLLIHSVHIVIILIAILRKSRTHHKIMRLHHFFLKFVILSVKIEYNAVSVENTAGRPTRNLALPFPAGLYAY